MIDPRPLWDFDDPAGSEQRLRAAAEDADGPARAAWLTQVARARGLQKRFDEGHALLDQLGGDDPEVATRVSLERGRLLRTSGDQDASRPHFEAAADRAREAGLDHLLVDALHMAALVAPAEDQVAAHERALEAALGSRDPRARDWDASILNNLGMAHADRDDHATALVAFEEALQARKRIGDVTQVRIARWMVAWSLRHLGRREEALALQQALRDELAAVGEHDPHVDEELALLEG